ncbi:hypothetical protein [Actinoplanes sp. DH11]|uniref:hypothetical protein n=1 Tax=Actinoplanes sp. DH11 TaxID=2857011 RepID=UPI001E3CC268|nr:hypothetical protein [Actinoplanes sp. DH11]
MIVRRLLVLLLLVIGLTPVVASPAWACSCKAGLADAELAFDGVVRSVSRGKGVEHVRFAVEAVVKGSAGAEVTLTTSDTEAACGYRFHEGGRYRVHAVAGTTSLCSGNELLVASPTQSARVERAASDRTQVFWVATGVVVLIVSAALTPVLRQPKTRRLGR